MTEIVDDYGDIRLVLIALIRHLDSEGIVKREELLGALEGFVAPLRSDNTGDFVRILGDATRAAMLIQTITA